MALAGDPQEQKTFRRPTTRRYLPILTNLPNHAFRDTNKFVQPSQIIIVTHKSSLHSTIIHSYTILYTPYYLCSFNDSLYRLFVRVKRHCYYSPLHQAYTYINQLQPTPTKRDPGFTYFTFVIVIIFYPAYTSFAVQYHPHSKTTPLLLILRTTPFFSLYVSQYIKVKLR